MKVLCALLVVCTVFVDAAVGLTVAVKNNTVYVDDKPVDLSKLKVMEDTPDHTTYECRSGKYIVIITKSKVGNSISVRFMEAMTEKDKKNIEEMQNKIREDVENNVKQVQENFQQLLNQLRRAFWLISPYPY